MMGNLRIGLFDPGMTALHRVGLAGLWMTLDALGREQGAVDELAKAGGKWQLKCNEIELCWNGDGRDFFRKLFELSFRLTEDGRIWLTGLGHPDDSHDLGTTLQDALLKTYLQHPKHKVAEGRGSLTLTLDDSSLPVQYSKVEWYQHQRAADDFRPERLLPVKGWLFPGGAVRHSGYESATALKEPPGRWLALLYAPVATFYFSVRRPGTAVRPSFCLALLDFENLRAMAELRRQFVHKPVKELLVSGGADAALRILSAVEGQRLQQELGALRCQVITFGGVEWVQAQQVRVDLFDAAAVSGDACRLYRLFAQALPAVLRPESASADHGRAGGRRSKVRTSERAENEGPGRWIVSPVLDLAASNLVSGRPWWQGFARLVGDEQMRRGLLEHGKALYRQLKGKGGLAAVMSEASAFTDRGAETIVKACHEAWRRRMGQLRGEADRRGLDFGALVERERERWRVSLAGCRNLTTLRAVLADFWARAGAPIEVLRRSWQDVLPYLTEARWQEARDLALLALVSYAGGGYQEEEETDARGE